MVLLVHQVKSECYGLEKIMEACYDFEIWKNLHGALDYQFISDPAYNRARGPVSVLGPSPWL